jgi:ABC-type polysaccharide/polyol phosphate transport system ATPase subunit
MYIQDEIARTINRLKRNYASEGLWRWVLRDVDFGIEPGASLGIVGANGSGKSTLLKILARVMDPTAGSVRVGGRVGALIELRAGLHPNLTGRENIFFTGTLMGLRRREVAKRLDEIVAFSELESAIDRQVKYYSSGMQMRLGFGVAAFLQPAVLLVDEVLAVGDATFQQRCLDRMGYVLSEGTTLILVSHDLSAVEATCARALWLNQGQIVADGPVRDALAAYRAFVEADAEKLERLPGKVNVVDAHTGGSDGAAIVRSNAGFEAEFTVTSDGDYRAWFFLGVSEGTPAPVFLINPGHEVALRPGGAQIRCKIPSLPLPRGRFYLWLGAYHRYHHGLELFPWQPVAKFDVHGPILGPAPRAVVRLAPVHVPSEWDIDVVEGEALSAQHDAAV